MQWHAKEHESIRFGKSTSVWSDVVHTLSLPDRTEVLGSIWHKGSFDHVN